jgi:hypothetical protein
VAVLTTVTQASNDADAIKVLRSSATTRALDAFLTLHTGQACPEAMIRPLWLGLVHTAAIVGKVLAQDPNHFQDQQIALSGLIKSSWDNIWEKMTALLHGDFVTRVASSFAQHAPAWQVYT